MKNLIFIFIVNLIFVSVDTNKIDTFFMTSFSQDREHIIYKNLHVLCKNWKKIQIVYTGEMNTTNNIRRFLPASCDENTLIIHTLYNETKKLFFKYTPLSKIYFSHLQTFFTCKQNIFENNTKGCLIFEEDVEPLYNEEWFSNFVKKIETKLFKKTNLFSIDFYNYFRNENVSNLAKPLSDKIKKKDAYEDKYCYEKGNVYGIQSMYYTKEVVEKVFHDLVIYFKPHITITNFAFDDILTELFVDRSIKMITVKEKAIEHIEKKSTWKNNDGESYKILKYKKFQKCIYDKKISINLIVITNQQRVFSVLFIHLQFIFKFGGLCSLF